jgi:hypothetical protein
VLLRDATTRRSQMNSGQETLYTPKYGELRQDMICFRMLLESEMWNQYSQTRILFTEWCK